MQGSTSGCVVADSIPTDSRVAVFIPPLLRANAQGAVVTSPPTPSIILLLATSYRQKLLVKIINQTSYFLKKEKAATILQGSYNQKSNIFAQNIYPSLMLLSYNAEEMHCKNF